MLPRFHLDMVCDGLQDRASTASSAPLWTQASTMQAELPANISRQLDELQRLLQPSNKVLIRWRKTALRLPLTSLIMLVRSTPRVNQYSSKRRRSLSSSQLAYNAMIFLLLSGLSGFPGVISSR